MCHKVLLLTSKQPHLLEFIKLIINRSVGDTVFLISYTSEYQWQLKVFAAYQDNNLLPGYVAPPLLETICHLRSSAAVSGCAQ